MKRDYDDDHGGPKCQCLVKLLIKIKMFYDCWNAHAYYALSWENRSVNLVRSGSNRAGGYLYSLCPPAGCGHI